LYDDLGEHWGHCPWRALLHKWGEVVELDDGTLFMNARGLLHRLTSYSTDGGITWSEAKKIDTLVEPLEGCEGSMAVDLSSASIYFTIPNNPSILLQLDIVGDQRSNKFMGRRNGD
jgi:hypothetical protein